LTLGGKFGKILIFKQQPRRQFCGMRGNMSGIDSNNVTMNHLEKTSQLLWSETCHQSSCFMYRVSGREQRIEALRERKQIFYRIYSHLISTGLQLLKKISAPS
jgi:hypothetical protein